MKITRRRGPRPATTDTNPHRQLDQQPDDPTLRERLASVAFSLPGVEERPTAISVPGARALWLDDPRAGPPEAFMIGREFAHLHPPPDRSLHLTLPADVGRVACSSGWAELHPAARAGLVPPTAFLVYAPRDDGELDVVVELLAASHRFASGDDVL